MKLRDILGVLRDSYCRRVGIEYMHIQDPEERRWIQERIERKYEKPPPDEQKHILNRLNAAEAFETFLQTKYVGQKRFSLEGGESLIPLLDEVLRRPPRAGWTRSSSAWPTAAGSTCWPTSSASRTRRSSREFEGHLDPQSTQGSGDVKYHLGQTGKFTTPDGEHAITVSRGGQPVAPGGGRPGAGGHRPGQAGPDRPQAGGLHRAAAAGAR